MEVENTRLANQLLTIPYVEPRKMTTAKDKTSLKSPLANQLIRRTTSSIGGKVYHYKHLPVEIYSQNWKLQKEGDSYSISFLALVGEKRVQVMVASTHC
jgi:putative transposase